MIEKNIAVGRTAHTGYPQAPYNPPHNYPEFINLSYKIGINKNNEVYQAVRDLLFNLGLDKDNYDTPNWKPFAGLIKRNKHAVIKPNFVKGKHILGDKGVEATITHASLIRPIIDYLLISTDGKCKITIADVPLQSSDWKEIVDKSGVSDLVDFYKKYKIKIDLLDLRKEISFLNEELIISKRIFKDRDPLGYATVSLGKDSAFQAIAEYSEKLMITDYDKHTVSKHHNSKRNDYFIAKTILDADLFINLPKLKTHKKTGITVAGKNLIGINGDKRWIAHHREGSIAEGGDEFPSYNYKDWLEFHLFAYLKRNGSFGVKLATIIRKIHRNIFKLIHLKKRFFPRKEEREIIESEYQKFHKKYPGTSLDTYFQLYPRKPKYIEGNWYGNDTLWRTISDLNHIIFFADKKGKIKKNKQRNYFCLVDGVVAGEGEGPMTNIPKSARVVLAGFHPLAIDIAASKIMGFDYKKIPSIFKLLDHKKINYCSIKASFINYRPKSTVNKLRLNFRPPISWKGHIEATRISKEK